MSDDGIWNGGKTNESKDKAIREWNRMIRKSEDYLDGVDVETQDIKERINTNMDKPCEISRMGGKGGPVEAIKARNEKK
tara:strand:+ start:677 stop:913 length:237 start_codon:yes stop_codon:yes gene_type:complete